MPTHPLQSRREDGKSDHIYFWENNKEFLKCSPKSLIQAVIEASTLNFTVWRPPAEAYLFPYNDKLPGPIVQV